MKGTENLHCEEQLKEFSLFTLEKRRLRCHVTTVFQFLKASYREDREIPPERTEIPPGATCTHCPL